jgi:hypothetical protein
MKKFLAYVLVLLALAAAAVVAHEVQMANEVVRNPELFIGGDAPPAPRDDAMFAKPSSGKRERMTVSELAWMLRESVSLGVIEPFAERGAALDAYNARISAYNERAAEIVYVDADMETARRRVTVSLDEIVGGAVDEALDAAADVGDGTIRRAQACLRVMGLYLSEPDGEWNDATAHAVRMFQAAIGVPVTGKADETLLEQLRWSAAKKLRPETIGF